MLPYIIEATDFTPEVNFNPDGNLEIKGQSFPADADDFYYPLMDWLEEYIKSPAATTTMSFKFIYFNTVSSKKILQILIILKKLCLSSNPPIVNWCYQTGSEDILEEGEGYQELMEDAPILKINLVEY